MSPDLAKDVPASDPASAHDPKRPITRDDIVDKFRELQGETDVIADEARSYALLVGAAAVAGLLVVTYLWGRRKGRKKRTVVEIRRV
jgi:hypothetical protein